MPRTARLSRKTNETAIEVTVDLDGRGTAEVATGVGFFDHMLNHLAKHSRIDIRMACTGDLHIDAHHTVEDCGLALGQAIRQALDDKAGISRYGDATVPMDETLVTAAIDLSGRPVFVWKAEVPLETLGTFSSQLGEEFLRAFAVAVGMNLHVVLHHGRNTHHILEGIFKAVARALRVAVSLDPGGDGIPSTKGVL